MPHSRFRPLVLAALVLLALSASPARAAESFFQLALFHPAQVFPAETDIKGVRVDLLYGKNANVVGLDWGLVHHATTDFRGYQVGLANLIQENESGPVFLPIVNWSK